MANSTILSGIQQSMFASFKAAQDAGSIGKLLLARVTGQTSGYDSTGNLVYNDATSGASKTYLFMGKKVYGTFPNLPLELVNALGLTSDEVTSGTVTSLTNYYTSKDIVNILKEIAVRTGKVASSANTIVVTTSVDDKGVSGTNIEVNTDNKTISANTDGKIFAVTSALPFVTEVKSNNPSSAIASIESAKTGENIVYTIGLSGGADGQVIKKTSAGTYAWAYENSTDIDSGALSGVNVSVKTDDATGAKSYTINGDFKISGVSTGTGSAVQTTYKLMVKDGDSYVQAGDEIKLLNDNYLKNVSANSSAMVFTWAVQTEASGEIQTKTTEIPFSALNTYSGGSAITIDETTNKINVDLSATDGNILKFTGDGDNSQLYASAVTAVTVDGTTYSGMNPTINGIVSAITGGINGNTFTADVTTAGVASFSANISAHQIATSSLTKADVNTELKYLEDELSAGTSGVLTVTVDGTKVITYNPSASTDVTVSGLVSAITIGDQKFTVTSDGKASIDSVSASAITYNYTENKNSAYTGTNYTVDSALTQIINDLAEINDNKISGLSAISAYTSEDGDTTLIQLDLNKSNTTANDPAVAIVSSADGAKAVGSITGKTATNAVKMSQDSANGLFVYIEIDGDDIN